jgi:glycerate 2-kinase
MRRFMPSDEQDNGRVTVLETIYRRALAACAPDVLVRRVARDNFPRVVVAIGKCAGALLDGFGEVEEAFVAIPAGYPRPKNERALVFEGGHPEMTEASFGAGKALLEFIARHDEITFLISGGGSACVEWPREGITKNEIIEANHRLIRSGKAISEINNARKKLSAIKGGRLSAGLRRSVTLVYSDVSRAALADVASGPSLPSTEVALIADNDTLTAAAAAIAREIGYEVVTMPQIECDVDTAAIALARIELKPHQILIAGGEPTVLQHGDGKGGRCSELAVRYALLWRTAASGPPNDLLFGSSDGVDGSSGAAGVRMRLPAPIDAAFAEEQLKRSNSMAVIDRAGSALPLCPSGNNLRDLYLLACS